MNKMKMTARDKFFYDKGRKQGRFEIISELVIGIMFGCVIAFFLTGFM